MIDAEVYLGMLIPRVFEAVLDPSQNLLVAPSLEVDELDRLPAVLWTITGDGQTANGDGLWTYTLTLSTFGDGMDQAKKFARLGYDVVHGWNDDPRATALSVEGSPVVVAGIEDIDLPSRLPSAVIDGSNLTQYTGSWALALRG